MSTFKSLQDTLKGDLVVPTDPDYEIAISRWAKNAARQAAIVAFVKDAEDVSIAIKYAKAQSLPIAVRGGGHSSAGASSVVDGLVIDLSRHMNTVEVDPAQKLARIAGGAVWENVDKAAIGHGLATVGGTVNHTGVGGLVLGGGYGWLSGSYGLAVDNLVQATVVTADGSIQIANETENADLFWGLRGGGGNFGVCVEFVMRLYDQRPTVFAGPVVFPPSSLEQITVATSKWWTSAGPKEAMIQVYTRGPDGNPCVVLFPFFNGTEAEGREVFKAFYDIGAIVDTSKEIPYEHLNALQNAMAGPGRNVYMKGVTRQHPRYDVAKGLFDQMVERSARSGQRIAVLNEFFPLDRISSIPVEATAFPNRGQQSNILITIFWTEGDVDEMTKEARETSMVLASVIAEGEENPKAAVNSGYANYDSEGVDKASTDRAKTVFGSNYPRLQQLKKKYDPDMMFSKWFAIQPAE